MEISTPRFKKKNTISKYVDTPAMIRKLVFKFQGKSLTILLQCVTLVPMFHKTEKIECFRKTVIVILLREKNFVKVNHIWQFH